MPRKEVKLSDAVKELLEAATPSLKDIAKDADISYATARYLAKGSPWQIRDATLDALLDKLEERQKRVARLLKQARAARSEPDGRASR